MTNPIFYTLSPIFYTLSSEKFQNVDQELMTYGLNSTNEVSKNKQKGEFMLSDTTSINNEKHMKYGIGCMMCGRMSCPNGSKCCEIEGNNIKRGLKLQKRYPNVVGNLLCGFCGRNTGLYIERKILEE
jgi:hypothetical protein